MRSVDREFVRICLLRSGRDRFDDTEGPDLCELRRQRSVLARRGVEDEEAHLVLGNVDCSVEADARSLARQLLGSRARPPLPRGTLTCGSAREEGLDEVARHLIDARSAWVPWKRQNV